MLSIYSLLPDTVVENVHLNDSQNLVGRDSQDISENMGTLSGMITNADVVSNVSGTNPLPDVMSDNIVDDTSKKAEEPVMSASQDEEQGGILAWLQDRNISGWFLVWCIGACICASLFVVAYIRCLREFHTALPVQNEYVEQWLEEHLITREIMVKQSDRISAPL